MHGDDAGGELAQPEGGEPAAADLREHREPLLGLVVAGETGAEHLDRLRRAVDLGDEVRAHLVLDERVGTGTLHRRVRVDEQGVAAHHDPVDLVADLGVHVDLGVDLRVVVDLGLGELEELLRGEGLPLRLGPRDGLEDVLGLGAKGGRGRPVELGAQRAEVLAVAGPQHVELEPQLALLGAQQGRQGRVLDGGDDDVVDDLAQHLGVGLELAVDEDRVVHATGDEVGLDLVGVHRGDVEQEAHRARHLRQGVVDGEVGDRDPAQRGRVLAHSSVPRPVIRSSAASTGS